MKTNIQLQSWLQRAAVLLITLAGSLPIVAQEDEIEGGEAFYIYQNDGHFDGFFYDQVKQISFSRLDTLGIEHDQYVSQEIVTADSVYRFMLSAIDSVSLVQPEIKFAKEVRFMRDEGMMAYYQSITKPNDDSFLLRFSGSMPVALQPKVGDVLSCPNLPDYEEAFVGKVKKVRQEGGETVIECGYVEDFSDVFEQFITVEQVRNVQTPEGNKTRRRIAGINPPKRAEGKVDGITLFDFSSTLETSYNFNDNLKFALEAKIGCGMTAQASYKITLLDFYIKTELKEQLTMGLTFSFDGRIEKELDMTIIPGIGKLIERFSKVPFPAAFPILYANLTPQPFTKAEAHLNVSVNTGVNVKAIAQSIELMNSWPFVRMNAENLSIPFLPYHFEPDGEFKVNAALKGSIQTGMKFPIEVGTEDWIKKVTQLKAGATVFAGPKLESELPIRDIVTTDGFYEEMKDTKLDLTLMSIDTELAAVASVWNKKIENKVTHNASFGKYEMTLFPNIEELECDIEGERLNNVKVKYNVDGNVFIPQMLGVGLYQQENKDDENFKKLKKSNYIYRGYFIDTFKEVELTFEDVEPGVYMVRPIILFEIPFLGNKLPEIPVHKVEQLITIASEEMLLNPEEIQAEEEGGQFTIDILTSLDKPITCEVPQSNNKWIKAQVVTGSMNSKELKLTVEENQTDAFRTGLVYVHQEISATEVVEKILTVNQYGGLQLSQSKLEFTKEGGDLTIDILTSYQPITVELGDASTWLSYSLNDRKLTITAKPNLNGNRTATIIISGWDKKKNRKVEVKLTITQKGLVDASIEPTELNFEIAGGTQPVYVAVGNDTEFTDVKVRDKSDTWVTVEKMSSVFNVTVKPNEDEKRTAYVDATFTAKDNNGKTYTVTLTVTINQKGIVQASVTPSELLFDAEGGDREAAITKGDYSHCGAWVEDSAKDWLSVTVEDKGEYAALIATATENKSADDRTGEITVYFSTVPNPQEKDMTKVTLKVTQKGAKEVVQAGISEITVDYHALMEEHSESEFNGKRYSNDSNPDFKGSSVTYYLDDYKRGARNKKWSCETTAKGDGINIKIGYLTEQSFMSNELTNDTVTISIDINGSFDDFVKGEASITSFTLTRDKYTNKEVSGLKAKAFFEKTNSRVNAFYPTWSSVPDSEKDGNDIVIQTKNFSINETYQWHQENHPKDGEYLEIINRTSSQIQNEENYLKLSFKLK